MTGPGATRRAYLHRIATRAPDDTSGLEAMIASGAIDPKAILAIFGKTEGNGCVNDFSRGFATRALKDALREHAPRDVADAVCIVMSGGTEGALAPHMLVMEAREVDAPAQEGALAIGRARTPRLAPENLGRLAQVDAVAEGVIAAMRRAGIGDVDDVHFVQIKCPLLTAERVAEVEAGGGSTATRDTLKSMGLSRAASALGVGVALGEIKRGSLTEAAIGRDWSLYSNRASASAGVELTDHEIVVIGTAPGWSGPLRVAHCVMRDALDVEPVRATLSALGLGGAGQLAPADRARMVAMLAKAEASSNGVLRGRRHARAFVAGALAGLVGHAEIYVSGGAEHQGPDGGGPVAVIASRASPNEGMAK